MRLIKATTYRDVSLGFTREAGCDGIITHSLPSTFNTQTLHEMLEELIRFISTSSFHFDISLRHFHRGHRRVSIVLNQGRCKSSITVYSSWPVMATVFRPITSEDAWSS